MLTIFEILSLLDSEVNLQQGLITDLTTSTLPCETFVIKN